MSEEMKQVIFLMPKGKLDELSKLTKGISRQEVMTRLTNLVLEGKINIKLTVNIKGKSSDER